jgi:ACR3 family arsenite efflux pump ArsB
MKVPEKMGRVLKILKSYLPLLNWMRNFVMFFLSLFLNDYPEYMIGVNILIGLASLQLPCR